jgi:hypothetical protein
MTSGSISRCGSLCGSLRVGMRDPEGALPRVIIDLRVALDHAQ